MHAKLIALHHPAVGSTQTISAFQLFKPTSNIGKPSWVNAAVAARESEVPAQLERLLTDDHVKPRRTGSGILTESTNDSQHRRNATTVPVTYLDRKSNQVTKPMTTSKNNKVRTCVSLEDDPDVRRAGLQLRLLADLATTAGTPHGDVTHANNEKSWQAVMNYMDSQSATNTPRKADVKNGSNSSEIQGLMTELKKHQGADRRRRVRVLSRLGKSDLTTTQNSATAAGTQTRALVSERHQGIDMRRRVIARLAAIRVLQNLQHQKRIIVDSADKPKENTTDTKAKNSQRRHVAPRNISSIWAAAVDLFQANHKRQQAEDECISPLLDTQPTNKRMRSSTVPEMAGRLSSLSQRLASLQAAQNELERVLLSSRQ